MSAEQSNESCHMLGGVLSLSLVITSLVLVQRIETCAPTENKNETNERKAIGALSVIALIVVLAKGLSHGHASLKQHHGLLEWVLYGLAAIVAILNLSYLKTVKSETCARDGDKSGDLLQFKNVNPTDLMANKNLMVLVTLLSIGVLVTLGYKILDHVGEYATKK
jgi:hypothetical protein